MSLDVEAATDLALDERAGAAVLEQDDSETDAPKPFCASELDERKVVRDDETGQHVRPVRTTKLQPRRRVRDRSAAQKCLRDRGTLRLAGIEVTVLAAPAIEATLSAIPVRFCPFALVPRRVELHGLPGACVDAPYHGAGRKRLDLGAVR